MAVNVPIVSEWKDQGLKAATRDLENFGSKARRQFDGIASFGRKAALAFTAAAAGAIALGKQLVDAASDFDESANKIGVLIGDASDQVIEFAKNAADIGISANAALEAAGTFAIFGKSAGLAGAELANFSTDFITLAADLASFNNATPEEAVEAIGAALRGEAEPLRRFGVLLDDATLKAEALQLGIFDGTGSLTAQQKVLAAQAAIFKQTGDAQGDFARTSDGLANQQRILAARLQNLRTELGLKLLPIFTRFAGFVVNRLYPAVERFTRFAWTRLTDAFQRARPFLERVAQIFNDYIRPAIERLAKFMEDNQAVVAAFLGVFAAAAVLAGLAALAGLFGALVTPLGLAVAAIAAVTGAFVYLYQNSETAREIMDKIGRWFRDDFPRYFWAVADAVAGAMSWLWDQVLMVTRWFQRTFLDEDSKWRKLIVGAWERWTGALSAVIGAIVMPIVQIITGMWQVLSGVFNFWAGILSGDWSRVWNGLAQFFKGWGNIILGILKLIIAPFVLIWAAFGDDITLIWNTGWNLVTGILTRVGAILSTILGGIQTALLFIWDNTVGRIISGVERILGAVQSVINAVTGLGNLSIPNPLGAIPGIIGGAARTIRGILPFADGGLVTQPTIGLIGEAGPEVVVPLDRLGQMGGGTVIVNVQGSVVSEKDLIEQIRVGLIRAQRSGKPLVA